MHTIIANKFIKREGYWFEVDKIGKNKYRVFNTQRKRNQIDRDGIGYVVEYFDTSEKAKKYLDEYAKG